MRQALDWDVPLDRAHAGLAELVQRGMAADVADDVSIRGVTQEVHDTAERLIAARREALPRLLEGWERQFDVAALLSKLAQDLQVARPGLVEAG